MTQLAKDGLYPKIKPYHTGYFRVLGGCHKLYYEECGNPKGRPIIFIHGGPGAGCSADDRRFFHPKKWRIVLFDQRGSGQSKPFCSLAENSTPYLISDIYYLLKSLGIPKTVLFGGSWGSTLALLYAQAYPETVAGMVLRGIYLSAKAENDYYLRGGIATHFPEVWDRFAGVVPEKFRSDPASYYHEHMTTQWHDKKERRRLAYEWARYELGALYLEPKSNRKLHAAVTSFPFQSLGVLEAHYLQKNCFLKDAQILENVKKLPRIPTVIVQGRYDAVCPPITAYRLYKTLREWKVPAKLHMVVAGHASSDPEIRKALVQETNAIHRKLYDNR